MEFLKEFFEKVDFEKTADSKLCRGQRVKTAKFSFHGCGNLLETFHRDADNMLYSKYFHGEIIFGWKRRVSYLEL